MKAIVYPSFLILVILIFCSFDNDLENSPAVKKKYDKLVATYMEEADKSCRKIALQEAKLTLGGEMNSGEEVENSNPRLSKPKTTH